MSTKMMALNLRRWCSSWHLLALLVRHVHFSFSFVSSPLFWWKLVSAVRAIAQPCSALCLSSKSINGVFRSTSFAFSVVWVCTNVHHCKVWGWSFAIEKFPEALMLFPSFCVLSCWCLKYSNCRELCNDLLLKKN